jgi:hypothetical protein
MKVSTAVDGSLIVECESFEGGKEKSCIRMPEVTRTEWGYLFFLILVGYFAGFNPLMALMSGIENLAADWQTHQFVSIILSFALVIIGANLYYALFLKTFTLRVTNSYRIDRNGSWSPYLPPNFYRTPRIISDEHIINEIDLTEDAKASLISPAYEDRLTSPPHVQILTYYQVVIRFSSGESTKIESNGLAVWNCDEDQAAFRGLIAETKTAVEQIKSFLAASKNKITQSSN